MITEEEIDKLEPKERISCKKVDGNLYIKVHPNGKKYWLLKYFKDNRERRASLGRFPQVSLSEALAKAQAFDPNNTITQSDPQVDLEELLDLHISLDQRLSSIEQSIANLFDQLRTLINDSATPIAQVLPKSIPQPIPEPTEAPINDYPYKPPPIIPNLIGKLPAKRKPNHFEPGEAPKW